MIALAKIVTPVFRTDRDTRLENNTMWRMNE